MACVNFARDEKMIVAIQGGGHNAGGLGTVDGGLVIKLSRLKGVRVDPAARTVRVDGGCTWGDVDHECYKQARKSAIAGEEHVFGCG